MAVFRVEHTRNFTVMSNSHLRDRALSLKAKGLLSLMLSLPEDWDYSIRGLAAICKEGVDAITSALRELEEQGYVMRRRLRSQSGRICDTEYVIYEQPRAAAQNMDSPYPENPDTAKLDLEKPAELKKDPSNTNEQNTDLLKIDSLPSAVAALPPERKRKDANCYADLSVTRAWIQENVEYDRLCQQFPTRQEELDELVELMTETVCAHRNTTRIAGSDLPHQVVRSRFLKLNSIHLEFVMDCLQRNTTQVRNIKQYLLAVLFNAPTTMEHYYAAQVSHDLYAEGNRPQAPT